MSRVLQSDLAGSIGWDFASWSELCSLVLSHGPNGILETLPLLSWDMTVGYMKCHTNNNLCGFVLGCLCFFFSFFEKFNLMSILRQWYNIVFLYDFHHDP